MPLSLARTRVLSTRGGVEGFQKTPLGSADAGVRRATRVMDGAVTAGERRTWYFAAYSSATQRLVEAQYA